MYILKRNLSSSIEKFCGNNDWGRRKCIDRLNSCCWTRWWVCWRWTSCLIMINNIKMIRISIAFFFQYKWWFTCWICKRTRRCYNNWSFMKNFLLMWWYYWCIEIILCVIFFFMNMSRLKQIKNKISEIDFLFKNK